MIAVFREDGLWAAVAKSNGAMSLYEYSRPLSLERYRGAHLEADDIASIGTDLDAVRPYPILSRARLKTLLPGAALPDRCLPHVGW